MAEQARKVVKENNMTDRIEVIQKLAEVRAFPESLVLVLFTIIIV